MKAIKKGYRKGGKMYQEGGNTGGPGDPPKATKKDLMRQINSLKKERDKMLGEQLILGKTKFAEANPKLKGLASFGTDSKVANQVRDYYGKEIDFLNKKMKEMEKGSEAKPYSRSEFLQMLGADPDA